MKIMYKINDSVMITEIADVTFVEEENCIIFLPLNETLTSIMLTDLPSSAIAAEIMKNLFQNGKVDITEYAANTDLIDLDENNEQDDEV